MRREAGSTYAKAEAGGGCPAGGSADSVRAAVEAAFGEIEADLADLGTVDYAKKGPPGGHAHDDLRGQHASDEGERHVPGAPDRTIPVTVWYPAVSTAANAAFVDATSPFPLVLRAHGFGAFRNDSADLAKHLASRGMIVVSPDFPLSNLNAPGGATLSDLDQQVVDVSFVIDRMLALDATPGGPFEGRIDQARLAAIGHSLGGATVLGTGYHATLHDPRLTAVIALAPLACLYQDGFFDGGDAPLMILSGTADLVTIPASNHVAAYGRANPEKYLVSLDGGLHIGFADRLPAGRQRQHRRSPGLPGPAAAGDSPPGEHPVRSSGGLSGRRGCRRGRDRLDLRADLPAAVRHVDGARAAARPRTAASCTAMLAKVWWGDVSADRLLTGRLDSENDDVTVAYER